MPKSYVRVTMSQDQLNEARGLIDDLQANSEAGNAVSTAMAGWQSDLVRLEIRADNIRTDLADILIAVLVGGKLIEPLGE